MDWMYVCARACASLSVHKKSVWLPCEAAREGEKNWCTHTHDDDYVGVT